MRRWPEGWGARNHSWGVVRGEGEEEGKMRDEMYEGVDTRR